jgi:predicted nucleic acid-binding protein
LVRYLLDTNVLISHSKQREPAHSWVLTRTRSVDELGICDIVVTEFFAGLPPRERQSWDRFFGAMSYWETSLEAARQAGLYRYQYARQGETIATNDALIAAVAVAVRATIVTGNVRHFPMSDIDVLPL